MLQGYKRNAELTPKWFGFTKEQECKTYVFKLEIEILTLKIQILAFNLGLVILFGEFMVRIYQKLNG